MQKSYKIPETLQGQRYTLWLDPRASVTRKQMRALPQIKDFASGTMRFALHLSQEELNALERLNPEFDLDEFVKSTDSKPYQVQRI